MQSFDSTLGHSEVDKSITAEEIQSIRKKYALSQRNFARVLGIGEASIARYETGQKPTEANANLIKAAADPRFMLGCLERGKDKLSEKQCAITEELIYSQIDFDQTGAVVDVHELYYLSLEQEILSEWTAEVLAHAERLLFKAIAEDQHVEVAMYKLIIDQLAKAKPMILSPEVVNFKKLAELRGQISSLKSLADSVRPEWVSA